MGNTCSRRRSRQQPTVDDWILIQDVVNAPTDDIGIAERIPAFDDDVSQSSSSDGEMPPHLQQQANDPWPSAEYLNEVERRRHYPNLRRPRLIYAGFHEIPEIPRDPNELEDPWRGARAPGEFRNPQNPAFRRAMVRWQHARRHITRLLTLRKIWSQLGRVLDQLWDAHRQLPHNVRAREVWSNLGRTLQRLNAKAIAGHLERKRGKLRHKGVRNTTA